MAPQFLLCWIHQTIILPTCVIRVNYLIPDLQCFSDRRAQRYGCQMPSSPGLLEFTQKQDRGMTSRLGSPGHHLTRSCLLKSIRPAWQGCLGVQGLRELWGCWWTRLTSFCRPPRGTKRPMLRDVIITHYASIGWKHSNLKKASDQAASQCNPCQRLMLRSLALSSKKRSSELVIRPCPCMSEIIACDPSSPEMQLCLSS